jgi:putative transcriptional regulator
MWSEVAPSAEGHEIVVRLDRLLEERGISAVELSRRTGITETNLSRLRNGNVGAMRFSTLTALCRELNCKIEDLLAYEPRA